VSGAGEGTKHADGKSAPEMPVEYQEDAPVAGEDGAAKSGGIILYPVLAVACFGVAFYAYRNKRRSQTMAIGGPDTLLG